MNRKLKTATDKEKIQITQNVDSKKKKAYLYFNPYIVKNKCYLYVQFFLVLFIITINVIHTLMIVWKRH